MRHDLEPAEPPAARRPALLAVLVAAWITALSPLALADSTADDDDSSGGDRRDEVTLAPPDLNDQPRVRVMRPARKLPAGYTHWAVATSFKSRIYGDYKRPWLWGFVRQDQQLAVKYRGRGKGCRHGRWWEAHGGGYVCSSYGFRVYKKKKRRSRARLGDVRRALPFGYGKTKARALRFERMPSAGELKSALAAVESGGNLPDVVERVLDGDYFIAYAGIEQKDGTRFYRTVRDRYVRADDIVKPMKLSPLFGERLDNADDLPLAFVYVDKTPVWCRHGDKLARCGRALEYARFSVEKTVTIDGTRYVENGQEMLIKRADVRVASLQKRPRSVDDDEKWVDIDLGDQVFVAYVGDRPVYTSLISSGKRGHTTPSGLYRVYLKYRSTKMEGDDPKDGHYWVGEVPWVMYYKGSYAVHGAYWHDTFGEVRSHGCTNIAPIDARWLYRWTSPRLPAGWQGMYTKGGTYLHFH